VPDAGEANTTKMAERQSKKNKEEEQETSPPEKHNTCYLNPIT